MKALIIIGIVLWLCFLAFVSIVLFDSMDYDPAWDDPKETNMITEDELEEFIEGFI